MLSIRRPPAARRAIVLASAAPPHGTSPTHRSVRPPLVEIAAAGEGADLGVGDAALEHPEAAVRVDVADPPGAERLLGALDRARDRVGRLDLRRLDVDDPEPEA